MIVVPDFSENKENAVLLYFSTEEKDEATLRREIERAYVCFSRIGSVVRNGKRYIVVSVDDGG